MHQRISLQHLWTRRSCHWPLGCRRSRRQSRPLRPACRLPQPRAPACATAGRPCTGHDSTPTWPAIAPLGLETPTRAPPWPGVRPCHVPPQGGSQGRAQGATRPRAVCGRYEGGKKGGGRGVLFACLLGAHLPVVRISILLVVRQEALRRAGAARFNERARPHVQRLGVGACPVVYGNEGEL